MLHGVQFITLFRKGSAELERLAHESRQVVETHDGFIVSGEDFFNEFQQDEEAS